MKVLLSGIFRKFFDRQKIHRPRFEALGSESARGGRSPNRSAAYFLERRQPRFLIGVPEIRRLMAELSGSHANWGKALLAEARSYRHQGLPIYTQRAFRLDGTFDWDSLSPGPENDALYPIRPHRFGFAPILAQAAFLDESYLGPLDETLRAWMDHARKTKRNRPYVSNLVVLYRLIALTWTWHFLAALDGTARQAADPLIANIFRILRADIAFLRPRLGDSHANNHLLLDHFGSWFISVFYPEFVNETDAASCEARWLAELQRQFYSDGGNFEHSVHYHELGCEAAVFYCLYKRRNEESPPPAFSALLAKMLAFQGSIAGLECRPWSIGDTTEDPLIPLAPGHGWSAGALREIDRALFRPTEVGPPASDITRLKAFWLLSGELVPPVPPGTPSYSVAAYPQAGFISLIDSKWGDTLLLRAGAGPSSAISPGHLHADILSLYWRHDGEDVLAASGTYSYRSHRSLLKSFRDNLRFPKAHSGLAIGDETPLGPMRGDFYGTDNGTRVGIRLAHDSAIALWCEGEVQSETVYDSYRRGLIRVPGRYMVVYDLFGAKNIDLAKEIGWQFAPSVRVDLKSANQLWCRYPAGCLRLHTSQGLGSPIMSLGSEEPLRGWVSESYGSLKPATHVAFPVVPGTEVTATLLAAGDDEEIAEIRAERKPDHGLSIEIVGESFRDRFLFSGDREYSPAGEDGPAFTAAMLQLSERQGRLETLSGLEISALHWPEQQLQLENTGRAVNARFERTDDGFETTYCQNAEQSSPA